MHVFYKIFTWKKYVMNVIDRFPIMIDNVYMLYFRRIICTITFIFMISSVSDGSTMNIVFDSKNNRLKMKNSPISLKR